MLEKINIESPVAVYVQIENHIRFAIVAEQLKPKDKLPSVRELSDRLGVNPNTVAKSYRDLEVEELLYTRRGMGVYIREGARAKCVKKCKQNLAKRIFEVLAEARAAGLDKPKGFVDKVVKASRTSKEPPYCETPKKILDLSK